jgi:hypothetical protein
MDRGRIPDIPNTFVCDLLPEIPKMLPPISHLLQSLPLQSWSINQLLCSRAVCSTVVERIIVETVDSNLTTAVDDFQMGPAEFGYIFAAIYSMYLYFQSQSPKYQKMEKLNQYVLSKSTYKMIQVALFVIFWIVKNPANAI